MRIVPSSSHRVTDLKPGWYWMQLGTDEWVAVNWTGSELYSTYHEGTAEVEWVSCIGPRIPTPDETLAAAPPFIIIPKGWDFEHIDCIRDIVRQELGK